VPQQVRGCLVIQIHGTRRLWHSPKHCTRVINDDRPSFGRANDGSEVVAIGIDQHSAAGEGKLPRLAAHLVIAAAGSAGRTRNADGFQQLSGLECDFERADYELFDGYAPRMATVRNVAIPCGRCISRLRSALRLDI
jgi:hypothetical protein